MTIDNKNIVSCSSPTTAEELPQSFPPFDPSDINERKFLPGIRTRPGRKDYFNDSTSEDGKGFFF